MAKSIAVLNTYYNGISSQSVKLGKEASFGFSSGFDFRSEPTELSVLPRTIKISGSTVTDLPMSRDIACDRLWFHGDTGNIYLVDDEDNVSLETQVSNSRGNGLTFLTEDQYLYIFKDTSIDRRQNACGTGNFFADFLENEGGAPTNTHSLNLNGTTQYASRADTASLSITGDLTLEAYVKPTSLPLAGEVMTIISKWSESGNDRSYKLDIVPKNANTHSLDLELSSSQFAYRADEDSLSLAGDFTIEFWVKPEQLASTNGSTEWFVAKYLTTGNQRSYGLFWDNTDDKLQLNVSDDGTDDTAGGNSVHFKSDSTLGIGAWVHVAVTFDISTEECKFYFNTVEEAGVKDGSIGASIFDGTANFTIGARDNGSNNGMLFYDGLIDDVRVWSDIRSEAEIQANYDIELVGNEANLVGYWKLNNTLEDETGNSLNLTGSGSPAFSTDIAFEITGEYSLDFSISNNGTATETYTKTISASTATWNRYSVTFDASTSTAILYENGTSLGSATGAMTAIDDNAATPAIGVSFDGAGAAQDFFDGLIDDVRVFNLIRTPTQIDANKNKPLTGTETGLVAYYKFDNNLEDAQTSGLNDLTGTGSPTYSTDVPFSGVTTRGDEDTDTFSDTTGSTYTLKAALSELDVDQLLFTPTKEPLKSIALTITTIGTGNWTVKVHDVLNREIATVTVANANLTTGVYEFIFDEVARPIRNAQYHVHVYSSVADGAILSSTVNDVRTAWFKSYFQVLVNSRFHPAVQFSNFVAVGNERYLAKLEAGALFDPHRLVFPSGYEVTAISQWSEFIAVGVSRSNRDEGIVFFWDGSSDTYSAPLYVPQGAIHALFGVQDTLFVWAGNKGKLFRYTGGSDNSSGGPAGKSMVEVPKKRMGDSIAISPYAVDMYQSVMRFGMGLDVESDTVKRGVYSYGHKDSAFEMSLGFDNLPSPDSSIFIDQDTLIGSVIARDDKLYVGWRNLNTYGIDVIGPDNEVVDFPWIETLIMDMGSLPTQKLPLVARADFAPLTSGQTIRLYVQFDRGGAWQEIGEQTTLGATHLRTTLTGRIKEVQFGLETRTGGNPMYVRSIGFENMLEVGRTL